MMGNTHGAWLQLFLPSMMMTLDEDPHPWLLIQLTEVDMERVSAKLGFIRDFENIIQYPQTTWTPTFLGHPYHMGESPDNWLGFLQPWNDIRHRR